MSASSEQTVLAAEEKIPSCKNTMGLGWNRFKEGLQSAFCKGDQNSGRCGVTFLSVMSVLQIILGVLSICLALVGLAAAFNVREQEVRRSFWVLKSQMNDYYQKRVRNMTKQADRNRQQDIQWWSDKIREMKSNNCTWTAGYIAPPKPVSDARRQNDDYQYYGFQTSAIPKYCDYSQNTYDRQYCESGGNLEHYHLIIDYLGIPGWTGIMLIITGLVGLRMVNKWKELEYLQVSHSYTVLTILSALLFAPGMLAVGILQMVFTDYWDIPFRFVVGKVTVGFAGVILMMSIFICVVNCCCPVKPHKGLYKEFSGEPIRDDNNAIERKEDAVITA